jgi:hypothetical protein
VPGGGDGAAVPVSPVGHQREALQEAGTQTSRGSAGQVPGDGPQEAAVASQHPPPQSDQCSAQVSAPSGMLSPPIGAEPAAIAHDDGATGFIQSPAQQSDAGGEPRGVIQLGTERAAAPGASADLVRTVSSPADSGTRDAAAFAGDLREAELSFQAATYAVPENGKAHAATVLLARAPSLSEGMAGGHCARNPGLIRDFLHPTHVAPTISIGVCSCSARMHLSALV